MTQDYLAESQRTFLLANTWGESKETLERLNHVLLATPISSWPEETLSSGASIPPALADWILNRARDRGIDHVYARFLSPWMAAYIPWDRVVEISTAGRSSPAMFKLFQTRHEIAPILHMCKPLKDTPLLELAIAIPVQFCKLFFEIESLDNRELLLELGERVLTHFDPNECPRCRFTLSEYLAEFMVTESEIDPAAPLQDWASISEIARTNAPFTWAISQDEMGVLFKNRVKGDRQRNVSTAIDLMSASLTALNKEEYARDWAIVKSNLGNAIRARPDLSEEDKLGLAIQHYKDAIAVIQPSDSDLWASVQDNLGISYAELARFGDEAAREAAIVHSEAALRALPEETSELDRTKILMNVATMYTERRGGDPAENLALASRYFCEASSGQPDSRLPLSYRAEALARFGDTLVRRADYEGIKFAERAVEPLTQALSLWIELDQPEQILKVGYSLSEAFTIRGDIEGALEHVHNSEKLIRSYRNPLLQATLCERRGYLYQQRREGEADQNYDLALASCEEACDLYKSAGSNAKWAEGEARLIQLIAERKSGRASEQFDRALRRFEQVLPFFDEDLQERGLLFLSIGIAHLIHHRITLDDRDLERAIGCFEIVRSAYPADHPSGYWARASTNIASTLGLFSAIDPDRIKWALNLCDEILKSCGDQDIDLWGSLRLAEVHLRRSLGPDEPETLDELILLLTQAEERTASKGHTELNRTIMRQLGHLLIHRQRWTEALDVFGRLADDLKMTEEATTSEWSGDLVSAELGETHLLIAYTYLMAGRPIETVSHLDQAGTRGFSRAMALRKQIEGLDASRQEVALDAYQDVVRAEADIMTRALAGDGGVVRLVSSSGDDVPLDGPPVTRQLAGARARLKELLGSGPPPRIEIDATALMALSPAGGAVIIPIITEVGGAVLIVTSDGRVLSDNNVVRLRLPHRTQSRLQAILGRSSESGSWYTEFLEWRSHRDSERWERCIRATSATLWEDCMEAVTERLAKLGVLPGSHLILVTMGELAVLPWHLAGPRGQSAWHLCDEYLVSSAPSISALRWMRQSENRMQRAERRSDPMMKRVANILAGNLSNFENSRASDAEGGGILAIANPTADLPFASAEGRLVLRHFSAAAGLLVEGEKAFFPLLHLFARDRRYLHFACHGYFRPDAPQASGLIVGGGALVSVLEIVGRWNLDGARLVTLSSCDTALPGTQRVPSEAVGPILAFLRAGAGAVIGALWIVDDLAAMLLMNEFYRHLVSGCSIAASLKSAQMWLRELSAFQLLAFLSAEATFALEQRALSDEHQELARRCIADRGPDYRPFASAAHWGSFVAVAA